MEARVDQFALENEKVVSLAARSEYLEQSGENPYAQAFIDFLQKKSIISVTSGTTANDLALSAMTAIQRNSEEEFRRVYEQVCRRKPQHSSDWLYNDFLLFTLAIGVTKLGDSADWLSDALRLRIHHSEGENKAIAQTLLDVVERNFASTSSNRPLLAVSKHLLQVELGPPEQLNEAYKELTEVPFPLYKSSFLNMIALRAVDVIVLAKELGNFENQQATDRFVSTFRTQIRRIAKTIWAMALAATATLTIFFIHWFLTLPAPDQLTSERLLMVLPLVGFSSLLGPVIIKRATIQGWLTQRLFKFFGHIFP